MAPDPHAPYTPPTWMWALPEANVGPHAPHIPPIPANSNRMYSVTHSRWRGGLIVEILCCSGVFALATLAAMLVFWPR